MPAITKYKKSQKRLTKGDRIFHIFNTIFWIAVMFAILYPLYLILIASISDPDAVMRGEVLWHPVSPSLIGYKAVLQNSGLIRSYGNSIFYTVVSVTLSIFVTLTAAYALTVHKFAGKGFFNLYFVFTMFFNGGLIPTFLVMRDIGLYNNPLIMILMGSVSVWNMMVARTYIQSTIPYSLYEAAELDGANHFAYFFRIVLPLCKTIVAVLIVYYGVFKWNDYFTGLVYLNNRDFYPLQTVLREILATLQVNTSSDYMANMAGNMASLDEAMRIANVAKYCIIVIATGPVVILYALVQKHFEKGVMIGSLKG